MEPRIQYARTSDGVNIAYAEVGEGRPLIFIGAAPFSHAELVWQTFDYIARPLAARFQLVTYDSRGCGLSDRDAIDYSMEAMIRDLEAIVARTRFDSFVLVVTGAAAVPAAVTYAVAHPERVSHLVLVDVSAKASDFAETPAYQAALQLLETDWVLFTETFGQVLWPSTNPAFGRHFAEYIRACCGPEAMRAVFRALESYDVTALLPEVRVPTLVVHNKNNRVVPLASGQHLAAAIPGARLALIDDLTFAPVPGLVEAFVFEGEEPEPSLPSSMTAILVADIADSTSLTERLGDAAFRAKARELDGALRGVIREHAGTAIEGKLLGDGVLAVFTSARQAIEAALGCASAGDSAGLPLHLGLHAGDVIREEGNVYGGAVNIASRDRGAVGDG